MSDDIDRRIITDDFLMKYFPSPNRFKEAREHQEDYLQVTLASSEQIYCDFRDRLNQVRRARKERPLNDKDIFEFLETARGKVQLPRPYTTSLI